MNTNYYKKYKDKEEPVQYVMSKAKKSGKRRRKWIRIRKELYPIEKERIRKELDPIEKERIRKDKEYERIINKIRISSSPDPLSGNLKLITDDDNLLQNTEYKSLNNSPKKYLDDYILMKEKKEILKRVEKIIIKYYEDFIEIFYNLNDFKLFLSMVQSFNDKYIYNFNSLKIPDIKEIQITLASIKYTSIK